MAESGFTHIRLDLKGQPFYFGVEAPPFTALRMLLRCLEYVQLPFPTKIKRLRIQAGDDDHKVTMVKRNQGGPCTTNPWDYQTIAGEAFWAIVGRLAEYQAKRVVDAVWRED